MKRNGTHKWLLRSLALAFLIGGAVALAHGDGEDEAPYFGSIMGPLPSELEKAALEALDAEYAMYAAYEAVIAQYGELEPYLTLREMAERNIEILKNFLGNYRIDYPSSNPHMETMSLPGTLSEAVEGLARKALTKAAMYADILEKAGSYRGIDRLFSYLARNSLKQELPALELAAANGGKLSAAQMARLGFGFERERFGPYGHGTMDDDGHCPMMGHGMWGRMGMPRYGGWGDCH